MFCMMSTWSTPVTRVCLWHQVCASLTVMHEAFLLSRFPKLIVRSYSGAGDAFYNLSTNPIRKLVSGVWHLFFALLLPSEETLVRIIESDPWINRYFTTTLLESFIKFTFLATALHFFFSLELFADIVLRINKSDLLRNSYFTITFITPLSGK